MAKKVMVGDINPATGEQKPSPYTPLEGVTDPDGSPIYTAANPPPANPALGGATPIIEGVGAPGVSTSCSRQDHVHPAGGGAPVGSATPLVESGAGAVGVSTSSSRQDHVHPAATGSPAVSNMKGAVSQPAWSGSVALASPGVLFTQITMETVAGHRFYWPSIYNSASSGGPNVKGSLASFAPNTHGLLIEISSTVPVSATVQYKVWRVDET